MSSSKIMRNRKGRTRMMESLPEKWKVDHKLAMNCYEVEILISECIVEAKSIESFWDLCEEVAASDGIDDYIAVTDDLSSQAEEVIEFFLTVKDMAAEMAGRGFEVKGAGELEDRLDALHFIQIQLNKTWPTFDEETWERTGKEHEEGRYRTAKEILNGLRGNCSRDD